jgi:hypothetical protein
MCDVEFFVMKNRTTNDQQIFYTLFRRDSSGVSRVDLPIQPQDAPDIFSKIGHGCTVVSPADALRLGLFETPSANPGKLKGK